MIKNIQFFKSVRYKTFGVHKNIQYCRKETFEMQIIIALMFPKRRDSFTK
jgi:hypothetical protein